MNVSGNGLSSASWHHWSDRAAVLGRRGGGGGGGSLPIRLLCPLREMRFSLLKPPASRPGTGEETLWARWNLLNSGLSAGHGRSRLADFFFFFSRGFPGCALAAERTAQCDSRRLWRKPYLVKVFVAVTQRDRPAINSAGGGTEINAKNDTAGC